MLSVTDRWEQRTDVALTILFLLSKMTTGSLVSGWRLLLRSRQRSTPMTEVTQPPSPWSADDARVARTSHQHNTNTHTKHRNVSQGTEWAVSQPPRTWTRLALYCATDRARGEGGRKPRPLQPSPPRPHKWAVREEQLVLYLKQFPSFWTRPWVPAAPLIYR